MKEKNSNSSPEVLEPNVGETNELAKNIEVKQETDKSTEDIILKEDETDKLAKDFEPKEEGTDKLDKKRAEVSRGAAKKRRKRNKKKKLAGRTGASAVLVFFVRPVYGSLILARSGAEESDGRARVKVYKSAFKKSDRLALSMSILVNLEDLLYVLCFSWFTIGTTFKS